MKNVFNAGMVLGIIALGVSPSLASHADVKPVPPLIVSMVGTWDVRERMWPAPGAKAVGLPAAVAHRRLVGNAFLQEVMEATTGPAGQRFTRIAYFDYNVTKKNYEYFSLDTRLPQMMNEKTMTVAYQKFPSGSGLISAVGSTFVAPRWGSDTNVAFRPRLTIGAVANNVQTVRLYLTPQIAGAGKEFLAFEYVYTRQ